MENNRDKSITIKQILDDPNFGYIEGKKIQSICENCKKYKHQTGQSCGLTMTFKFSKDKARFNCVGYDPVKPHHILKWKIRMEEEKDGV